MKFLRLLLALALCWFAAAALGAPPALVLVIVVDGLPQEQLVKYRELYGPGGFRLLFEQGAWFADAHHGHAATLTAPGHAAVLTGAHPYRHGVIANEWLDRKTLEQVYCAGDTAHRYLGEETKKLDGTSPANLHARTVGDELRDANGGRSKVIAISGKDRGAILLAGHRGTAYMYMERSGRFASSSYYMKEHPAWVAGFFAAQPQDRWFGQSWNLQLPEASYAGSLAEGQPWMRSTMLPGARLPLSLALGDKPGPAYYRALAATPFGDELTLAFARAAVEGEDLGRNPAGVTDILAISLSTHDYVNHAYGPESRPSQDHLLHLDRALAGFLGWLEQRVGAPRLLVALTSDHGFTNAPEYSQSRGLDAGRIDGRKMFAALNEHLAARFGAGAYVRGFSYPTLLLDYGLIEGKGLARATVETEAAEFLAAYPGMAAAFTRTQLESGKVDGEFAAQIRRAWHPQLSGDLYLVQRANWIFSASATTHGSPYAYDSGVPLMLYGRSWIRPGQYASAAVADLAPTLARLLEVRPPAESEGRVLGEALLGKP